MVKKRFEYGDGICFQDSGKEISFCKERGQYMCPSSRCDEKVPLNLIYPNKEMLHVPNRVLCNVCHLKKAIRVI